MLKANAEVQREVRKFWQYLSPKVPPAKIELALRMATVKDDWKKGVTSGAWQRSGVYFIHDSKGHLLYVGKATATYNKRVQRRQIGISEAAATFIIPFEDQHLFLAHALEAFLIARLRPPHNKLGSAERYLIP